MADRIVVNCDAQLAVALFREAAEWAAKGDLVNEQKALDAARAQLELAGIVSQEAAEAWAEESVPLTPEEEAQAVVDAAAAAGTAAEQAVFSANDRTLRDRVEQGLSALAAAHANWGALTAVQKDTALRLNVRVTLALARLQLRRLDSTD